MQDLKTDVSVTLDSDTHSRIKKLKQEFDLAEKHAKAVEEFRDEAAIPAINELRYAGYHLALFMDSITDGNKDAGQLTSAINHCRRASYEASEAGILAALSIVAGFQDAYKEVVISDVVQGWQSILLRCDEVKDEVTQARQTGDDQVNDHEQYKQAFEELQEYCKTLEYSRDDLNTVIRNKGEEARKFLITIGLTIFGILVTIVIGVMAIF